ncbi:hypothetical protein NHQ30_007846 [Ciborinia camelliae]|nr:hypothetical protein NHQ30_007846 [Ciborinia camelliae]
MPTMYERGIESGDQNRASVSSSSAGSPRSVGTERPNPSSRGIPFLDSIDTLVASPPPPVRTLSKANAVESSVAERVRDGPYMYAPERRVNDGATFKMPKPSSDSKPAGDKLSSLIPEKKTDKATLPRDFRHAEGYMGTQLSAKEIQDLSEEETLHLAEVVQPRIKGAKNRFIDRLEKSQHHINKPTSFTPAEEDLGMEKESEHFHQSQVKKTTSRDKVPNSTTKPTLSAGPTPSAKTSPEKISNTKTPPSARTSISKTPSSAKTSTRKPNLLLPQKPQTSTLKQNHQLPEKLQKPRHQQYKPVKIDTLPGRNQDGDVPVSHLDTPPAIRAYRERYLPSIRTGSPTSNKPKTTVGSSLESSMPEMGSVLSTLAPVTLFSTKKTSSTLPAEKQNELISLSQHPYVSGPREDGSFQTPGAIPYNLTPSPPSSIQDDDEYDSYGGGRSSSPSENGPYMANTSSISVNEAAPIPVNETVPTPTNETAPISTNKTTSITIKREVSSSARAFSPGKRATADEEIQNTGHFSHSPAILNGAAPRTLSVNNTDTYTQADKEMQEIIDLTDSPPDFPSFQARTRDSTPVIDYERQILRPTPGIEPQRLVQRPAALANSAEPRPEFVPPGVEQRPIDLTHSPEPTPEYLPQYVEIVRAGRAALVADLRRERDAAQEHSPLNRDERALAPSPELSALRNHVEIRAKLVDLDATPRGRDPAQEHTPKNTDERASAPSPEPFVPSLDNDDEETRADLAAFDATIREIDAARENPSQNRDGRAPSPEPLSTILNKIVHVQSMASSSEEVSSPVDYTEPFHSQGPFEVAAPPGFSEPADELLQDEAGHDERSPDPPISFTNTGKIVDAVAPVEVDSMEMDKSAEVDKSFEAAASVQGNAMDIDEQLSSDLSDVPSESNLALKEETERLLKAKRAVQAELNRLTDPTFPPSATPREIDDTAYQLAKEGEDFNLASALFSVITKKVYDQIWMDEFYRPQISLAVGPAKWVRPLDPKIRHPAKADPSSTELINVLCEIENLLVPIWSAVESIVVIMYCDLSSGFTANHVDKYFRRYQCEIFIKFQALQAHLLTLADWKESYFATSNIKKRALRNNANPYTRLFNVKNPAGIVFYGSKKYLRAMKAAIADAQEANDCACMKDPKWKNLVGLHRRALGEEFSNCLDGLRKFNTFVRKRDWDVAEALKAEEPSKTASEQPAKDASNGVSSKVKEKAVVIEDSTEEKSSDDLSDGDPPDYYEENDDEDDEDYVDDRPQHRQRAPQVLVQPPTPPRKKRGAASITRSTSRPISTDEEMKVNNEDRSSPIDNVTEFGDEFPARGRTLHRAGSVPTQTSVKGVQKGAKRIMVEVSRSSSPNGPVDYFETP